jgi:hypothetical protein
VLSEKKFARKTHSPALQASPALGLGSHDLAQNRAFARHLHSSQTGMLGERKPGQRGHTYARLARALALISLLGLALACTSSPSKKRTVSGVDAGQVIEGITPPDPTTDYPFQISQAFLSNMKPNWIDVIGVGGTSVAQNCTVNSSNSTGTGVNPFKGNCQCKIEIKLQGESGFRTTWGDTTYIEDNLLRCAFFWDNNNPYVQTSAPVIASLDDVQNITQMRVRVELKRDTKTLTTNVLDVTLLDSGLIAQERSEANLVPVLRHQCRPSGEIPLQTPNTNGQNGFFLDPFMNKNMSLYYGLNFYMTNPARTSEMYASGLRARDNSVIDPIAQAKAIGNSSDNGWAWLCSLRSIDSTTQLNDMEQDPTRGTDYALHSRAPLWLSRNLQDGAITPFDSGDFRSAAVRISPSNMSLFDRTRFSLSRTKTQTYSVPVHADLLPGLNSRKVPSRSVAGAAEPLGYAAPISGNSCPSSALLPPGYQWVKLWKSIGNNPVRTLRPPDPAVFGTIGGLYCNTPKTLYPVPVATFTPRYERYCNSTPENVLEPTSGTRLGSQGAVDRIVFYRPDQNTSSIAERFYCLNYTDLGAGASTGAIGRVPSSPTGNYLLNDLEQYYAGGTDGFTTANLDGPYLKCSARSPSLNNDPLNLCEKRLTTGSTQPHRISGINSGSPYRMISAEASQSSLVYLDGNMSGRKDVLLIVTPPSVTQDQLMGSQGAIYDQYAPVRILNREIPGCGAGLSPTCPDQNVVKYTFTTESDDPMTPENDGFTSACVPQKVGTP